MKTGTRADTMTRENGASMTRTATSTGASKGSTSAADIERTLAQLGLIEAAAGSSPDFVVEHPIPFDALALDDAMDFAEQPRPGCIAFARTPTTAQLLTIAAIPRLLLLLPPDAATAAKTTAPAGRWLYCANPRLAFALALQRHFEASPTSGIDPAANIHANARIGDNTNIAPFAVIGAGAVLGARTVIGPHAVIHAGVSIGQDCRIGAGSCLGGPGFGYELGADAIPQRVPQLGALIIEDGVEIGENATINRAALSETIIGRHAKIDDQVYIAHNVRVGEGAFIMAGVRIMGSAVIGARAELNPGALIGQGARVGADAVIAMGAAVLQDVPDGAFAAGVPAQIRRRRD